MQVSSMGIKQGKHQTKEYQHMQTKLPVNIRNNTGYNNIKPYMLVPYVKGMSESCKDICKKHMVLKCISKEASTIMVLLLYLKETDTLLQKSGVTYRYKCG